MSKKRKQLPAELEAPKQPERCAGCVWGRWTGVKQVCSMPRCVKWWGRL